MENLTLRAAPTNQPHYVEEASLTSPCQHELWVSSRRPWRRMQQVPAGAVRIYYVYSMKLSIDRNSSGWYCNLNTPLILITIT